MLGYKTVIRPALIYESETWPITVIQADKIGTYEMRMLVYRLGISLKEHKRYKGIAEEAGALSVKYLTRKRRMPCHGHICCRKPEEDIKGVCEMRVDGERGSGRSEGDKIR